MPTRMGPFPNQKWKNMPGRCDRKADLMARVQGRVSPDAEGEPRAVLAAVAPAVVVPARVDLDLVAAVPLVRVARGSEHVDSVSRPVPINS